MQLLGIALGTFFLRANAIRSLLMEIEAKFSVADANTARTLRAVSRIGDFSLSPAKTLRVRDTFFDTRANALYKARHVLRVRQRSDGAFFITHKTPAVRTGAVHRRPETEVKLAWTRTPTKLRVAQLPARIRSRVAPITNEDLDPTFSITQTREVRTIRRARRVVAEWSLDFVKFRAGKRQRAFYELEIELKKTGTENDLENIVARLQNAFALPPQTESKFLRAVEFMRGG